ncbi:MAG: ribonuclease III family protein [Kiritimatiellia bacterium]
MSELEARIGYTFKNTALLDLALSTPSVRMVDPQAKDNQRLEFLGDAVFGLLAADSVYARNPNDQEGLLTVRRTHLVSGVVLAAAAEKLDIRRWLKRNVGAHEIPPHAKLLADALEALMGAIWLDGGLAAARAFFSRLDLPFNEEFNEWDANPKGFLQTQAQACHPPQQPVYEILKVMGAAHEPVVTVRVSVRGLGSAEATAVSKSAAEVAAAAAFLKMLKSRRGG